MKSAFYILLFCLFCNLSFAQDNSKEKAFINDIITATNVSYLDSGAVRVRKFMSEGLKNRKAFYHFNPHSVDFLDTTGIKTRMLRTTANSRLSGPALLFTRSRIIQIVSDSLVLTDKETAFIHKKIENMRNYKWGEGLLTGGKLLAEDSLTITEKRWSDYRDQLIKSNGYFTLKLKNEGLTFYQLSCPIFLRNDTYCLFYYTVSYSSKLSVSWEGSTKFAVYKKENGKWKYWALITGWQT